MQNINSDRNKIENFFIELRTSKLFSILNITSIIYSIVLISTFAAVYGQMPIYIVATHVIGLSIVIGNIFLAYKTENIPRSAGILLFCMLTIHLVNITIVGGINNPHFAWLFIFPILAGGTLGWRGQIFFYICCLLGTIYFYVVPESINLLSDNDNLGYTLFTRIMCLSIFTLIMLVYYFTLNEKMQHLQKALDLASFESDLFLGVFNSKAQSVIMTNQNGQIERANAKSHEMFGFEQGQLLALPISQICSSGIENLCTAIKHRQSTEAKVTTHNGQTIWLEYTTMSVIDEDKNTHTLITMEDISIRKNHEAELSYLARFDHLTRLPNRLSLQEKLNEAIAFAKTDSQEFAVVFFDLDKFKNVNDIQGHQAGDTVLIKVAQRIQSLNKANDFVARFGGDEFVLVITNIQSEKYVTDQVKKIQDSISKPISNAGSDYYVGSSAGVAFYPQDAQTANDLIQKADMAMYKAKSNGRGQYQFYSIEHDENIKRQIKLSSELNFAIERDQLNLLYQPIYHIDGKICGAEALVRWNHDELGIVSPNEFIPVSEENGLIVPIGLWVLDESCRVIRHWHDLGYTHLVMSVNVSYRQINSDDMVKEVQRILTKYQLSGASLILELTERVFADDLKLVQRNITKFTEMGVQTAIDDFGVGYSSLSYLKKTKFSSLKIDRDFIKDIDSNSASRKLCSAITTMASGLGLSVTAEGVETNEQLQILTAMNIDKYQGYLMSKPIESDAFEALLSNSN
ncbi:sensor domain-containing protein [Glaciecola petra]|uniref:EAL domain-containing protein n=1 Tax=Glaciecola petra TaxID=3075602 RepID=A0ABU2ZRB3_9ALTE|nr:EAL domain-containing protein [Aestuariibacter sp. P117]MDT0594950.1 EAL domain-containing protein [Aestuariibacter sp. P117]